jgi:hypothetical protein
MTRHADSFTAREHPLPSVAFITTLAALYITSGGIHLSGDLAATPKVNVTFLLLGAALASFIGTTYPARPSRRLQGGEGLRRHDGLYRS